MSSFGQTREKISDTKLPLFWPSIAAFDRSVLALQIEHTVHWRGVKRVRTLPSTSTLIPVDSVIVESLSTMPDQTVSFRHQKESIATLIDWQTPTQPRIIFSNAVPSLGTQQTWTWATEHTNSRSLPINQALRNQWEASWLETYALNYFRKNTDKYTIGHFSITVWCEFCSGDICRNRHNRLVGEFQLKNK